MIEVVAHRLSTVRHAHQICVLDKGKLAESGTHDETCQKSLLQEAIWLADRVRGVFNRCSGDSCFGAYVWFVPKELIRKEGAYEKLLRLQLSVMTEDFWTAICVKNYDFSALHYYQHSIKHFFLTAKLSSFHSVWQFCHCSLYRKNGPAKRKKLPPRLGGITKSSLLIMMYAGNSCWCFIIVS